MKRNGRDLERHNGRQFVRSMGTRGVTIVTVLTFIFAPLGHGQKGNKIVGKTINKTTVACVSATCPTKRTIVRTKYTRGAVPRKGDTTNAKGAVAAYQVSSRKAAARKAAAKRRAAARRAAARKRAKPSTTHRLTLAAL